MSSRNHRRKPPSQKSRRKTRFAFDERSIHPQSYPTKVLSDELLRSISATDAPHEFQRFFECFGNAEWASRLDPSDLLAVLNEGGELSERARREVTSLRMFADRSTSKVGCVVVSVNSTAKARLFGQLMDRLGPSLISVALDYEAVRTYNVTALSERCKAVKSLTLRDKLSEIDLGALLRFCAPNLTHLELEGSKLRESHVTAIAMNCVQLEVLRIAYDDWDTVIITPWQVLGGTLKQLSLKCPPLLLNNHGAQVDLLAEIKEHCSELASIELEYSLCSDFSFAIALCKLQGSRLKSFKLKAEDVLAQKEDIAKIFAACPNVSVDADIWHDERPFRLDNASHLPQ